MPRVLVILRDGSRKEVEAKTGISLMENLRGGGVDEIEAFCGGQMACATCHVYIDERFASLIPARSELEGDLIGGSGVDQPNSRLSCQIRVTDDLDGLELTVAPE